MFHLIQKIKFHEENGGGGICDMTLYYLLDKLGLLKVQNLLIPNEINHKEYVFMNNINTGEGYEIENQFKMKSKSIQVLKDNKNNENKIFDLNHNKDLYIYNIHYQGSGKKDELFLKYKIKFLMLNFLYCFDENYNVQGFLSMYSLLEKVDIKIQIYLIHKSQKIILIFHQK